MRLVAGFAGIAAAAVALAACATVGVGSFRDLDVDFTRYRTFDWGPADALPTGDPRLDRNPYFQDRLQGAVERGLALRRVERAAPGAVPELLIHYHANVSHRLSVHPVEYAYGGTVDAPSQILAYEAGTIVLDLVDARTNQLVWRGWAQRDVADLLDDEERMTDWIDTAVRRMLARLPPVF